MYQFQGQTVKGQGH